MSKMFNENFGGKQKYLTLQEINYVIANSTGDKRLFFIIAAITGKRITEILNLKVNDVNFHDSTIKFNILKRRTKHTKIKYYPHKNMFTEIKKYISEARLNEQDFLFKGRAREGKLNRGTINYHLRKINENYHPHQFRHAVGFRLADMGHNEKDIQEFLDHARISSTEMYLHISGERMKEISTSAVQGVKL